VRRDEREEVKRPVTGKTQGKMKTAVPVLVVKTAGVKKAVQLVPVALIVEVKENPPVVEVDLLILPQRGRGS
jgi:hypothetical protein